MLYELVNRDDEIPTEIVQKCVIYVYITYVCMHVDTVQFLCSSGSAGQTECYAGFYAIFAQTFVLSSATGHCLMFPPSLLICGC